MNISGNALVVLLSSVQPLARPEEHLFMFLPYRIPEIRLQLKKILYLKVIAWWLLMLGSEPYLLSAFILNRQILNISGNALVVLTFQYNL